uniref:Uncharacterized protein n=1 Tax=Ditylenchus dipsaci TaxID=166011 RepID=A0A915D0F3_9BILA
MYMDPKDVKFGATGYGGNLNNVGPYMMNQHSPLAVGQMNFAPPGISYNSFRQMMPLQQPNVNTMDHFAQYEGSLEKCYFF